MLNKASTRLVRAFPARRTKRSSRMEHAGRLSLTIQQKPIRKRWLTKVALACLVASFGVAGQVRGVLTADAPARPLARSSWLRALAITVDTTPLGHLGGTDKPHNFADAARFRVSVRRAVALAGAKDAEVQKSLEALFAIDGEELYRLNCRACHGPRGAGLPPEVSSIVGLASALSPALLEKNMRAKGVAMQPRLARELAQQAEQSLRARLWNGGKEMPPFPQLSQPEIGALIDYLQELAGVERTKAGPVHVTESGWRIGEQVIQGTCRICHDGSGPGAGHLMLMAGRIPALANLPEQLSLEGVVHKVRHGWTGMDGMMHQMSRMPTFSYLSDEEIAAAYLYIAYQPVE
jgi:mono/diheme cytochrome c family protein